MDGYKRFYTALSLCIFLAACAGAGSGVLPFGTRSAQTAHAIPVTTPTPTPSPGLLGGLLSPVIGVVLNILPVCSIIDLSQAQCGAVRNLNVSGMLSGSAPGYHPSDLQKAYNLPSSSAGYGQTIGIVVAYDDPNAESDLAVYRSQFNLPACTTANGCFRKIAQSGSTLPSPDQNWGQEVSVDLDAASAVCPNCHLLLVEANSASASDLIAAVHAAVAQGATVVSNSYTIPEQSSLAADQSQLNFPGVPIVAGAGDSGYGVGWPASLNNVIAVGGTSLKTAPLTMRGFSETAWSMTGGGCSAFTPKPAWQSDSGCSMRTVDDVSADADPYTGISVYDTYLSSNPGWLEYGGTSVATPIVAAAIALAGNGRSIANAGYLYAHRSSFNDVTSGNNGSCNAAYLCNAVPGYDAPTGVGSPKGVAGL
jgi:subtilase family serine protease